MYIILLTLSLVSGALAIQTPKIDWNQHVADQNKQTGSWKAALAKDIDYNDIEKLKKMIGLKKNPNAVFEKDVENPGRLLQSFPTTFDLRTKYPKCSSLFTIRNQYNCGGCWAFAAATTLSDRMCIKTYFQRAPFQRSYSYQDLLECCPYEYCGVLPGLGCQGGFVDGAFEFAKSVGLVTGEGYGNFTTCKPFFLSPANPNPFPPMCTKTCTNPAKYPISYLNDKKKILGYKTYSSLFMGSIEKVVQATKGAIMRWGSVVGTMEVYEDFYTYSQGVYSRQWGEMLGGHAVRIIGWGTDPVAGPFWLCINSWGSYWGDKGYFKIKQGVNESLIEMMISEGIV